MKPVKLPHAQFPDSPWVCALRGASPQCEVGSFFMQKKSIPYHPLTQKWFHSFTPDGKLHWQGQVIGQVEPGLYLCQLYGWLDGSPTHCELVAIAEMKGWRFYCLGEEMNFAYEKLERRGLTK